MKRLLFLVLVLCLCVTPVIGFRANMQGYDTSDLNTTDQSYPVLPITYPADTTGEISAIPLGQMGYQGYYFTNRQPKQFTYLAWDNTGAKGGFQSFAIYDQNWNSIEDLTFAASGSPGRYEMKIIGGTPTVFFNGAQTATFSVVGINPTYFKLWNSGFPLDNFVLGESDHHIVGALPTNWTIQRDLLNPAATGVYAWSGSAWVAKDSTNFYLDADKEGLSNENVLIKDFATQTTVNTTVVSSVRNQIRYNITQFLNTPTSLGTSLPDGMYTVSFDTSPAITDTFWVISSGATISWGQPVYSQGSTGTINYAVAGSGYWDQSTYSYSMVTTSLYGTVMNTQTIPVQSGIISVPITSSYTPGVYYAEITATKISDGTVHTMNYAVMSVTTYIPMNGYVMNEETGAVIPSANMNISQGLQYQTVTTDANGTWNSNNGWVSGSTITINTTATGFKQDLHPLLPLNSASIFLNISMSPLVSTYSGISVGGKVTDNKFGNPVVGAVYHVVNGTESNAVTNIAGYARVDGLVNNTMYAVWSSKTGYGNSTIANVTAVGI